MLSLIGDRVMLVALPFAVLEAGGDLEAVGLVVAAELVPFLLFALVGGVRRPTAATGGGSSSPRTSRGS